MCYPYRMAPTRRSLYTLFVALAAAAATATAVKHKYNDYTVHVVFSNHLDVGFTDLDSNVINLYFHEHYPRAIHLAQDLALSPDNPHGDRLVYTTHSWLLSLFFDCPPNMGLKCPNNTEVSAVRAAISDGIITWHAAPFNPQYEVFNRWLLGAALDLTHDLDDHFNKQHKKMVSLRDVPGLTRAAIPVFKSRGIRGLTAGVNGFSAPPGVPHMTPFIWRDEESNSQIIAMWHPGGYSGTTYGLQIDSNKDCIRTRGLKHVMCVSWRNDNNGPPDSLGELLTMFRVLRQQWPGARILTSSLDDYLGHLTQAVDNRQVRLPVVTGEIGDTWVHGVASDPGKMSDYRAVLRAVEQCQQKQQQINCSTQGPEFKNFTRLLMKVPEHTWGVSFGWYFGDVSNYTNAWLHSMLAEGEAQHKNLAVTLESWRRQRRYIDWALDALPHGHFIREYVETDRTARRSHAGVNGEGLAAVGAVAVLHSESGEAEGVRGALQVQIAHQHSSSRIRKSSDRDLAGGSKPPAAAAASGGGGGGDGGGSVCNESKEDLIFCSKHWLMQINKKTGGLLRLQRLYGSDNTLGTDWAAAAATDTDPAAAAAAAGDDGHDLHQAEALDSTTSVLRRRQQRRLSSHNTPAEEQQQQHTQHHHHHHQQQQQELSKNKRKRHHESAFCELQYNVYSLDDYEFVWDHYAYIHPVWVGDFGKWNMSATVNMSKEAKPELVELYHSSAESSGVTLHLKLKFEQELVEQAGAPEAAWVVLHSPSDSAALHITLTWQHKTPTRLPEALWLRFKPGRGAVDDDSWTMNKINSSIRPTEVLVNGSHSIHAVDRGVTVSSRDQREQLSITTLDVPLANAGKPNPFYNPIDGPDMSEGVSFNIVNNVWGTNYIMWVPYSPQDEPGMAFRFVITAERTDAADV